ncbi:unnamed protein product [Ectocarpus sp. CCAP 1310/34]|nr:unnamed protein product [Ectocarpus sp. CCAP 1310/34]
MDAYRRSRVAVAPTRSSAPAEASRLHPCGSSPAPPPTSTTTRTAITPHHRQRQHQHQQLSRQH